MAQKIVLPDRSNHERPAKPAPRVSRQRRERMKEDACYLVIRDMFLEQHPTCVKCGDPSSAVHHVCRGIHRAHSLLVFDTFLPVCSNCHELVEGMTIPAQIKLKQQLVKDTIERYRR